MDHKMVISPTTKMPRISDRDLMEWYGLNKGEVKKFKEGTGHKFMREQISITKYPPLKRYMQLVFSQKKHLELFLAETKDIELAFELFIVPFVFCAQGIISTFPIDYHEYASSYTEKMLRLKHWLSRKALDEFIEDTKTEGGTA